MVAFRRLDRLWRSQSEDADALQLWVDNDIPDYEMATNADTPVALAADRPAFLDAADVPFVEAARRLFCGTPLPISFGLDVNCAAIVPPISDGKPGQTNSQADSIKKPSCSTDRLLAVVQMCAGIRTLDRLSAMVAPGAITTIDGDVLPEAAEWVLSKVLFPHQNVMHEGLSGSSRADICFVDGRKESGGSLKRPADLRSMLVKQTPHIILLSQGSTVAPGLADAVTRQVTLPLFDTDSLARLLSVTHSILDDDAEEALRRRMPDDNSIGRLTVEQVLAALRAPDVLDVADRLRALSHPAPLAPIAQSAAIPLEDLVGYGAAKEVAIQILADLLAWQGGTLPDDQLCRGLLLFGPPGTGKTQLAQAMAQSSGIKLITASYADWQRCGHLGDFLKSMRKSFEEAISAVPTILFIDEVDAFRDRSTHETHGASYDSKAVAGLLQELDGIASRAGVVVIAACNNIDHVDPAIRRAGRFDHCIEIGLPSLDDLAIMLRQQLGSDLPDADLPRLALLALGRTGADSAAALRNARALARRHRRALKEQDLAETLGNVPSTLPPLVRWRVAVHEAGHAVVALALNTGKPLRLHLAAEGGSFLEKPHITAGCRADILHTMAVKLGGRAAEQLVVGSISAGAGGGADSDIAKATSLAQQEETIFGIGGIGPLWLGPKAADTATPSMYEAILSRICARLREAEALATAIIAANMPLLLQIARDLEREGLLTGRQLVVYARDIKSVGKLDCPELALNRHLA